MEIKRISDRFMFLLIDSCCVKNERIFFAKKHALFELFPKDFSDRFVEAEG